MFTKKHIEEIVNFIIGNTVGINHEYVSGATYRSTTAFLDKNNKSVELHNNVYKNQMIVVNMLIDHRIVEKLYLIHDHHNNGYEDFDVFPNLIEELGGSNYIFSKYSFPPENDKTIELFGNPKMLLSNLKIPILDFFKR